MPSRLCRTMILSLFVLLAIAALPVLAAPQPAAVPVANQPACAPGLDLLAVGAEAPVCEAPSPETVSTPLDFLKAGGTRGYCSCSCSFTPNCSTDADCGGGRCLKGPTCC